MNLVNVPVCVILITMMIIIPVRNLCKLKVFISFKRFIVHWRIFFNGWKKWCRYDISHITIAFSWLGEEGWMKNKKYRSFLYNVLFALLRRSRVAWKRHVKTSRLYDLIFWSFYLPLSFDLTTFTVMWPTNGYLLWCRAY